jgi:signal transduction histidine kinase
MVWYWLRRRPFLVDVVVGLGVAAAYVGNAGHRGEWSGGVPLALLQTLPLLVRRRFPFWVLAATTAGAAVYRIVYWNPLPFAVALAVYTVAAHRERIASFAASAAAGVFLISSAAASGKPGDMFASGILLAAAWVFGDNLGTRRAYLLALEERAERLEREQEAERARAVAEEQARIGRELHDVIAHNVSVMVVQAAAANDVFDTRPERARDALRAIEATGRSALAELRRLLFSVRGDGADYAPQPGLERLDELVAQVRAAGLAVAVRVEGAPRPLPTAVDLSAYRIVQEALTNTLKHAHATRADVALRYGDGGLDVEIRDDGRGGAGNGSDGLGRGLVGMRERVGLFGGSLAAGPSPGGGFAVAARFPLEADA